MSPRGVPTLGSGGTWPDGPQVLGTLKSDITDPTPQGDSAQWEGAAGAVSLVEPPPPWELQPEGISASDARRFIEVPENIEVRWINPKVLDAEGWRDWQPVLASDPRFKVRVHTMVTPDNNIRRGGPTGDILAWMYKSWVLSRRKQFQAQTAAQTQRAVDTQQQLKEDFQRGKYGPHIRVEHTEHPRYTQADGRSMATD